MQNREGGDRGEEGKGGMDEVVAPSPTEIEYDPQENRI